jgi:hypothetical protein
MDVVCQRNRKNRIGLLMSLMTSPGSRSFSSDSCPQQVNEAPDVSVTRGRALSIDRTRAP